MLDIPGSTVGPFRNRTGIRIAPGDGVQPNRLSLEGERAAARLLLAREVYGSEYDAIAKMPLYRMDEALHKPWPLSGDETMKYIRHAGLMPAPTPLFPHGVEVGGDAAGGEVRGIPLLLACDYDDDAIRRLQFKYDAGLVGADEMEKFVAEFEFLLHRLATMDRSLPLETLLAECEAR